MLGEGGCSKASQFKDAFVDEPFVPMLPFSTKVWTTHSPTYEHDLAYCLPWGFTFLLPFVYPRGGKGDGQDPLGGGRGTSRGVVGLS